MLLDEYLHTRIMNAHPDKNLKNLIAIYRHDFIELFKIWIPLLDFKIARQLELTHYSSHCRHLTKIKRWLLN